MAVAPNSSSLLSSQVHSSASLRTLPHLMHLPILNPMLQDSRHLPVRVSHSRQSHCLCSLFTKTGRTTENGCCWAALATTILCSYTQLLTEVRPDKAKCFLGQKGTTGRPLAQENSPSGTNTGFYLVSLDREHWGEEGKTTWEHRRNAF